jgi:hypothetical protein
MTINEFLRWLGGYLDGIDAAAGSTAKTEAIKEKLSQISEPPQNIIKDIIKG